MSRPPGEARSVYLHIGEPKTGTTYLQQILWANRPRLASQGLLVPGKRPVHHWAAAQDLREVEQVPNDPFGPVRGSWDKLAAEALDAPAKAIITHELLAAAEPQQAARAVASLPGVDVHVVLTVRDIATLLPAEWQETVKHRNTRGWRDWLADVIDHESTSPDRRQWWFWRVHDTVEIVRMWSALLPPERIHVITVPHTRRDPDLLWRRFATVLGLDPAAVDTTSTRSNASLGLADVEFLRRFNAALPDQLPDWLYMRSIKDGLAHDALAGRSRDPSERLYLPADRDEWARKYAEALVGGLRDSGCDLVGDPDELLPPALPEHRPDPSDVAVEQVLSAAVDAAVALAGQVADTHGVGFAPDQPPTPAAPPGRLKRLLVELSRRSPLVHRLRRGYWQLANVARRVRGPKTRWRAVEDRNIS